MGTVTVAALISLLGTAEPKDEGTRAIHFRAKSEMFPSLVTGSLQAPEKLELTAGCPTEARSAPAKTLPDSLFENILGADSYLASEGSFPYKTATIRMDAGAKMHWQLRVLPPAALAKSMRPGKKGH